MPKFVQAYFRQTALRAQLWKRVRRIIGMQYVPLRIHADEIIPCVVIATPFPVLFLTLPQAFQRSVPAQKLTATNLLSRGVYGSAFRQSQRAYLWIPTADTENRGRHNLLRKGKDTPVPARKLLYLIPYVHKFSIKCRDKRRSVYRKTISNAQSGFPAADGSRRHRLARA